MKRLIKKYQNGNNIVQREQYRQWLKLSPIEKFKRNWRIARSFTNNGANITNLYNAGKAIVGGFNPTNPDLITGAPEILPGRVPLVKIPKGYTFVKQLDLKTKNGSRIAHMVKDPNGKFKILEDLNLSQQSPKVNLKNYSGERLTGNEEGFDDWALTRTPETDHFANLSHGLNNEKLLPIMNREFEALPNGSRVDLGEIFSSDSSSNLLQYVRKNNKRIKMVLPKNLDEMVSTNEYGTRGADAARIFNEQLDKLLDLYGYSPTAVPKAVYNQSTNTLSVPKLSFIKLYKKGNKFRKIWS